MDRRSVSTKAREQLLHIEEAKYTLRPVVPPIALERKFISMLNPSKDNQESTTQQPRTTATATAITVMTSSTTVTTAPSLSPPASTTSTPRVAQVSPPESATTTLATATTAAPTAASIVGGKRPLGEESPLIILVEHQDEEVKRETTSDLPGSDLRSRRNQSAQKQPHLRKQKPEERTRKLSTGESTSERGNELGRKRGKHGVQFSDVSPKRDVGDIMQFFQEQEKSLQERFLSLPKQSQKKQRSPSPKLQHAAGLEHLDNLIRLMEQLTSLKDENSRLRKRCDYLESTKILLQAKRDLTIESSSSSSRFMTLQPKHRQQEHHHHLHQDQHEKGTPTPDVNLLQIHEASGRLTRPRISSAEELEYIEIADSSSDQAPKKAKSAMHKRSFSTGSLEVPSEMTTDIGRVETIKRIKGKTGRSIFGKSSGSKQKSKNSKWARVKKVLTGQKLYEDLGTTIRTLRDLGRSSHVRYSTTVTEDFSSTSSRISHGEVHSAEGHTRQPQDLYGARTPLAVAPVTESVHLHYQPEEDADLTSEIWMGPPDWWEEYEARKESAGTSSNSEVSSVIEVTTMYLGAKKETATSTIVPATTTLTTSVTAAQEKYLSIDKPLPRRQSSPSLVMKESTEEDDILQELTTCLESTRVLHKSSSCKSADLDIQNLGEGRQTKKSHRSAWGRVKDIIHTRKDSIKKKPKRGKSGIDSEETSEIDVEGLLEEHWRGDVFDDGLIGRSTPKSSPMVIRQQSAKGTSESFLRTSAPLSKSPPSRGPSYPPGGSPGNIDMAALLAGSMSDEFNKKMQEWEQMKTKKASFRASMDESEIGSLDVPIMTHEFPVRTIDLRDLRGKVPDIASEGITPDESNTSMEVLGAPSINVEEIQRRMTESFSRKMQEWERLKYKGTPGAAREPSPDSEKKEGKGRKDDRQKSKRSREEKEKEKWERQREREMQKVEREQVKLEKEKLRIEKERLRTLEREAKLEKMKGRLSQTESEGAFKNPVLSPLAEYKVTADFARKLHEWELKKGLSHDVSNSIYMEAQKMGMQHLRRGGRLESLSKPDEGRYTLEEGSRVEGGGMKASPPPPLTLQPYWDSPEDTSPVERYSEASIGDGDDETCTSMTEECLTRSNILTLERANRQLVENLQQKELEYAAVQEEVQKVNEKLAKVRENHATEMARFHRELALGNFSGPLKLEVGELETTVGDLEQKIKLMENFGDKMASSMESAAIGKWQSIEGEETVHTQLVELVDQMRGMLQQASQSEEQSQKTMALSNFETLYTQAMKLQVQMNNLRLSHLERNREIMIIKRQLLLQEVNNLLLQADITRRETELYQFHEAKRFASLKRWNTFSGTERQRPHTQMELAATSLKSGAHRETRMRPTETPRINIPYIPEEMILASATSSSISAPASPLCLAGASDAPASPPSMSTAGQLLSTPRAAYEQSTDHLETHLHLTPSLRRRDHQVTFAIGTSHSQQRIRDSLTVGDRLEPLALLQLPKLAIHVSPKKYPPEQPLSFPIVATSESKQSTTAASPEQSQIPTSQPVSAWRDGNQTMDKLEISATLAETSPREVSSRKGTSGKLGITTICDSAPLHMEIRELRREKRKVEKGPPTLKSLESEGLSSAPSPGKVPRQSITTEAPTQSIPKQRSLDKPRLTKVAPIVDDDYFPEPSVMKCTETLTVLEQTDSELGAVGGISLQPQAAETTRRDLPYTSDQSKTVSVSLRSPVSKSILRNQKEEKDKLKDYHVISPKGSPVAARGKPPLPPQATPFKQSPTLSSASEKGPRSKSVSDMDDRVPESAMSKPLQEAVRRFEKCATVCETEDRPVELRKTPSPTLHLPRVGLVSRVRRLKPAAELLEESHRYRSGHSIYATRILQRYLPKDDHRQDSIETAHDKENFSGTHVQTIVPKLSHETTPIHSTETSRTNSELSLKQPDSPRAQSEFVTDIVKTLSSPSEPEAHKITPPFRDLTNEGQVKKLTQAFISHASTRSQERTLSDSDIDRQHDISSTSAAKAQNRKSCEVAIVLSSSVLPMSETSYQMVSSQSSDSHGDSSQKPVSTITPISCQSLPTIHAPSSSEEATRGRAATYCVSDIDKSKPTGHGETIRSQLSSPSSSSFPESQTFISETSGKAKTKSGKSSKEKADTGKLPSLSPDRRVAGRGKMGTVGVLCKQSISFDLGVSLYSQKPQAEESIPKSRQARSWDPSESARAAASATSGPETPSTSAATISPRASSSTTSDVAATAEIRPVSTSSEGEVPSSPTTMEKKRSRRFLDSSWLQKSKKFFKVSK